jgi:hypothetical protein
MDRYPSAFACATYSFHATTSPGFILDHDHLLGCRPMASAGRTVMSATSAGRTIIADRLGGIFGLRERHGQRNAAATPP